MRLCTIRLSNSSKVTAQRHKIRLCGGYGPALYALLYVSLTLLYQRFLDKDGGDNLSTPEILKNK